MGLTRDFKETVKARAERDELRGVDHVGRAARMQHRTGVGELAHQPARPAGMIQMHVRQQHEVDRRARDAQFRERGEQVGDRCVRPHIDKGGATGLDDNVRSDMPRVQVLSIDGADAVRVSIQSRPQGNVDLRGVTPSVVYILTCTLA